MFQVNRHTLLLTFLFGLVSGVSISTLRDYSPEIHVNLMVSERQTCTSSNNSDNNYVVLCNGETTNGNATENSTE